MATIRCPTCGVPFESKNSTALPFCCLRCKQVDLGRWLNEEYGVPSESDPDPDHESAWMEEEEP